MSTIWENHDQDRYVRKASSSHTPEQYERRLDRIFDLESRIWNEDWEIARLKDRLRSVQSTKATINRLLKRLRTELDWETTTLEEMNHGNRF